NHPIFVPILQPRIAGQCSLALRDMEVTDFVVAREHSTSFSPPPDVVITTCSAVPPVIVGVARRRFKPVGPLRPRCPKMTSYVIRKFIRPVTILQRKLIAVVPVTAKGLMRERSPHRTMDSCAAGSPQSGPVAM